MGGSERARERCRKLAFLKITQTTGERCGELVARGGG